MPCSRPVLSLACFARPDARCSPALHVYHAGTWTYSYYSNGGNLNGNDAGMGGDYSFSNVDHAWYNSNGAVGTMLPALANLGSVAPSFDDSTTAGGVVASLQMESPTARFSAGIVALTFTGAKTGIAVGRFGGFADYDQVRRGSLSSVWFSPLPVNEVPRQPSSSLLAISS